MNNIYDMLPDELKEYSKKIIADGGEFDLEFKNFINMNIETCNGQKVITSAKYIEDDTMIEWHYKCKTFMVYLDGVLILKS
jgi:ribonucleotide reductase alpha subunit